VKQFIRIYTHIGLFLYIYYLYVLREQIIENYYLKAGELRVKTFAIYFSVLWIQVVFCWPYIIFIRLTPRSIVYYLTVFLIIIVEWIIWMRLFFEVYIKEVGV